MTLKICFIICHKKKQGSFIEIHNEEIFDLLSDDVRAKTLPCNQIAHLINLLFIEYTLIHIFLFSFHINIVREVGDGEVIVVDQTEIYCNEPQ